MLSLIVFVVMLGIWILNVAEKMSREDVTLYVLLVFAYLVVLFLLIK